MRRVRWCRAIAVAAGVTAVFSGCGPGVSAPAPTAASSPAASVSGIATPLVLNVPAERASLVLRSVAPKDVDLAIDTATASLVAFDPTATSRGQLFVFLGGAGSMPANSKLIVRQAAANGFHVLGLAYQNTVRVGDVCEPSPDENCWEKAHLTITDGTDRGTAGIAVTRAGSIENRLTKLLAYLAATFPDEGWATYLAAGKPSWTKFRLGGHSLGGAQVAILARDHEVARVCMIEAPVDLIGTAGSQRRIPPWVSAAIGATPLDRYFVMRHLRSSSPNAEAFPLAWTAFGLDRFGPMANIDSSSPPFERSHELTTNADPSSDDGAANLIHRSMIQDSVTPRTPAGGALYAAAWQYLCFS